MTCRCPELEARLTEALAKLAEKEAALSVAIEAVKFGDRVYHDPVFEQSLSTPAVEAEMRRQEKGRRLAEMIVDGAPHNWLLSAQRGGTVLYEFLQRLDQRAREAL